MIDSAAGIRRKERQDADKKEAEPAVHWLSGEQGKKGSDPGGQDAGGRVLYRQDRTPEWKRSLSVRQ